MTVYFFFNLIYVLGERHCPAHGDVLCSEWTPHTNSESKENRAAKTLQGAD